MIRKLFSTITWRQSQITIIGTIVNGALGALFYILVARFLGPANFGLLAVSIATLTLIADIADLGTNTGLVRHVSANIAENRQLALKYLNASLKIKLVIWVVVSLLGIALAPSIAELIYKKPELSVPLQLVMVGVGGALLFSFATSALQALQKFTDWSLINISVNLVRLIIIVILFNLAALNLLNTLTIYIILPFMGFFLSLMLLPSGEFLRIKNNTDVYHRLFTYNKWVALFTLIAAISSRVDIFLNTRLLTVSEVGIYAAASQLTSVMPQLVGALGTVASPKFASFQNNTQMLVYFKKFQIMVTGIGAIGLLAIPSAYIAIPWLLGSSYTPSIPPFIILFLAMTVFLLSVPLHNSIFYYFSYPKLFVWVSIGHLAIMGFAGYVLISEYGVIGASLTVLVGTLFNFIVPLIWFLRKIRSG